MEKNSLTILKASAGSGKTYTLATRFVAHLMANVDHEYAHREMLAITFTNKATTEMKERILSFLYSLSQNADANLLASVNKEWKKENLHFDDVVRRASKALKMLTSDYSNFSVLTIDSFFQRLLRTVAHELGISINNRVELQADDVISKAIEAMLKNAGTDKPLMAWLLSYVEDQMEEQSNWSVAKVLGTFVENNLDKDEFQLLTDEAKKQLTDPNRLRQYAHKLEALSDEAAELALQAVDEAERIVSPFKAQISGYNNYESKFRNSRGLFNNYQGRNKLTKSALNNVIKQIDGVITKDKSIFKNNYDTPEHIGEEQIVRDAFQKLKVELTQAYSVVCTSNLIRRNIKPMRLLFRIDEMMRQVLHDNNAILLSNTKILFQKMIGEEDSPFVFERVGTRYRYIMIDEFQDTALIQWNNIKKLLLNSLASGYKCLIVGDIKQSIYRWNNGDWRILYGLKNDSELTRLGNITEDPLNDNWRSLETVVDFNNKLFPLLARQFDEQDGERQCEPIYDFGTQPPHSKKGKGGFVKFIGWEPYKNDDGVNVKLPFSDTPLSLAAQLRVLHEKGVSWNDMAILVRRNNDVAVIAQHLQEQAPEINLVTTDRFQYSSSRIVPAIICAMRWICAQRRKYSSASQSLKETMATAYLRELRTNLASPTDMPTVLPHEDGYLDEAVVFGPLYETLSTLQHLPLVECCHRVVELLGLDQLAQQENAFLLSFLDEVVNYVKKESDNMAAFLQYYDDKLYCKTIPPTQVDGVRVLTIHKAKGLEFHSVFVPQADFDTDETRHDYSNYIWWEPTTAPYNDLPMVPITFDHALKESKEFKGVYNREMLERHVDCLNLAYVAFTRPKQNLFVWASNKSFGNMLKSAVLTIPDAHIEEHPDEHYALATMGMLEQPEAKAKAKANTNPLMQEVRNIDFEWHNTQEIPRMRQSHAAADYLDNATHGEPQWRKLIERGKLRHKIMEQIHTSADLERTIMNFVYQGIIDEPEAVQLLQEFRQYLQHPEAAGWFDGSWEVFNETVFLKPSFNHAETFTQPRADRVMRRGDEVVVVDYKFSQHTDNAVYRKQVQGYMQLLAEAGYQQVKGYLWYVDSAQVIPVFPSHNSQNHFKA